MEKLKPGCSAQGLYGTLDGILAAAHNDKKRKKHAWQGKQSGSCRKGLFLPQRAIPIFIGTAARGKGLNRLQHPHACTTGISKAILAMRMQSILPLKPFDGGRRPAYDGSYEILPC